MKRIGEDFVIMSQSDLYQGSAQPKPTPYLNVYCCGMGPGEGLPWATRGAEMVRPLPISIKSSTVRLGSPPMWRKEKVKSWP